MILYFKCYKFCECRKLSIILYHRILQFYFIFIWTWCLCFMPCFLFSLCVTGKVNKVIHNVIFCTFIFGAMALIKKKKNLSQRSETVWEWPIGGDTSWTGRRAWHWTACASGSRDWSWRLLLPLLDLPPQKTCQEPLVEPQRVPPRPRNDRSSALASSQTRGRCFSTTRGVLLSASFTHSWYTSDRCMLSARHSLFLDITAGFKALYNVFPS